MAPILFIFLKVSEIIEVKKKNLKECKRWSTDKSGVTFCLLDIQRYHNYELIITVTVCTRLTLEPAS